MSSIRDFVDVQAVRKLFDLHEDAQDPVSVIEEVSRNVVFRGTNLWILIFAIVICSVGLNVNSTAVIIGAMLISPLMGPIIGVGVGAAIFDSGLIRKALRNLLIAVAISIASSALYFFITPLHEAQSELLARTSPTLWDVLIGMFGGLAGIVAATRKERTNVIPGVAIATALMPPLCTTGFGIATGNWQFAFGALYLFFINAVFISVSAFVIVRVLGFPSATFVDPKKQRKVRIIVGAIVLITVIPSIWLAYVLVDRTLFEKKAKDFITQEFDLNSSRVVEQRVEPTKGKRSIEVFLLGEPITEADKERIQSRMPRYGLDNVGLKINEGSRSAEVLDVNALRSGILEELYAQNQTTLAAKDSEIVRLKERLLQRQADELPMLNLIEEIRTVYPDIESFTCNRNLLFNATGSVPDTALVVVARFRKPLNKTGTERLGRWLKVRTGMDSVVVVIQ